MWCCAVLCQQREVVGKTSKGEVEEECGHSPELTGSTSAHLNTSAN